LLGEGRPTTFFCFFSVSWSVEKKKLVDDRPSPSKTVGEKWI
jgi:hypothetical protein